MKALLDAEELFSGGVFDVMGYVLQEIKTEMCNDRYEVKIENLIQVLHDLAKLNDETVVTLYKTVKLDNYFIALCE